MSNQIDFTQAMLAHTGELFERSVTAPLICVLNNAFEGMFIFRPATRDEDEVGGYDIHGEPDVENPGASCVRLDVSIANLPHKLEQTYWRISQHGWESYERSHLLFRKQIFDMVEGHIGYTEAIDLGMKQSAFCEEATVEILEAEGVIEQLELLERFKVRATDLSRKLRSRRVA